MRKIFYSVAGLLTLSGGMSITAQQAVVDTTNVYELNEVVVSAVQARRGHVDERCRGLRRHGGHADAAPTVRAVLRGLVCGG